jgi:Protein of unknown function (DUF998)
VRENRTPGSVRGRSGDWPSYRDGARNRGRTLVNSRYLARMALAAVALFLILLAGLHFIEPEFDPSRRLISEYELGRYGGVMSLAFFSLGLGVLAMLRSTWDSATTRRGLIGRWWFVAIGIALFGTGIFYPYFYFVRSYLSRVL